MRKTIILLLVSVIMLTSFSSCKDKKELYVAEWPWPELSISSICHGYVTAPNFLSRHLVYLEASSDRKQDLNDTKIYYFSIIKDVPPEKYLAFSYGGGPGVSYKFGVVKPKDSTEVPIKDFTISKAEIYWHQTVRKKDANYYEKLETFCTYGKQIYGETIAEIPIEDIKNLISTFSAENALDTIGQGTDIANEDIKEKEAPNRIAKLRIYFEEYENIVWDAHLRITEDGEYAVAVDDEAFCEDLILIPLSDNIVKLIEESISNS